MKYFIGNEGKQPATSMSTIHQQPQRPIIIRDPEILSGTPCFYGTRVPFKNLLDYLEQEKH